MAVPTKILLFSLLVHAASSTEGERPARTLSFLGFGSSSSSQPKSDPQPQQVSQVSQTSQQQQQQPQQQNGRPFVYNVRYISELPSPDRTLRDRVLLYTPGQERVPVSVPCPLDHVRVGAGHKDKVSGPFSYQQQSMVLSDLLQPATTVQQQPGSLILPFSHPHQPHSVVVPTVVSQASQTPGNVLLSVLQPVTQAQQPGVVLPVYSQAQQAALNTHQPHLLPQQQQPQPPLPQQQQQKVAPFMAEYPYYYFYPEFVYVVPVLQQQQQQLLQQQQHQQHTLSKQQQPHQQSLTAEDVRVQQHQKQQQRQQQHQQQQQQQQQHQQAKQKQ